MYISLSFPISLESSSSLELSITSYPSKRQSIFLISGLNLFFLVLGKQCIKLSLDMQQVNDLDPSYSCRLFIKSLSIMMTFSSSIPRSILFSFFRPCSGFWGFVGATTPIHIPRAPQAMVKSTTPTVMTILFIKTNSTGFLPAKLRKVDIQFSVNVG